MQKHPIEVIYNFAKVEAWPLGTSVFNLYNVIYNFSKIVSF